MYHQLCLQRQKATVESHFCPCVKVKWIHWFSSVWEDDSSEMAFFHSNVFLLKILLCPCITRQREKRGGMESNQWQSYLSNGICMTAKNGLSKLKVAYEDTHHSSHFILSNQCRVTSLNHAEVEVEREYSQGYILFIFVFSLSPLNKWPCGLD